MRRPSLFTIAICTKNRPQLIKRVLLTVVDQLKKTQLHIPMIIVDSSDETDTQQILAQLSKSYKRYLHIIYLHADTHGLSTARNIAVQLNDTQFICFIDDDSIPRADWLSNLASYLSHHKDTRILFGPIHPKFVSGNSLTPLLREILQFTPWIMTVNNTTKSPHPFAVNVAINRDVFQEIGLFNPVFANTDKRHYHPFGEDPEFYQRVKEHGIIPQYTRRMAVEHMIDPIRSNMFYLAKRYYDDGENLLLFMFYSKRSITSFYQYLSVTKWAINHVVGQSRRSRQLGLIFAITELLGWSAMTYKLIRHFSYYDKNRLIASNFRPQLLS